MAELSYLSIVLPSRNNVREPMPKPTMRLVAESGRIRTLTLSEPQLLAIITDATATLKRLHDSRDAVRPCDNCGTAS